VKKNNKRKKTDINDTEDSLGKESTEGPFSRLSLPWRSADRGFNKKKDKLGGKRVKRVCSRGKTSQKGKVGYRRKDCPQNLTAFEGWVGP